MKNGRNRETRWMMLIIHLGGKFYKISGLPGGSPGGFTVGIPGGFTVEISGKLFGVLNLGSGVV